MFSFQKNDFRIEACTIRSISKATIDPRIEYTNSKGEVVRQGLPVSVARSVRQKLHGVTRFHNEYPCNLAFVGDQIVSMAIPTGANYQMWKDTGDWICQMEEKAGIVDTIEANWMWDGQYAYKHVGDVVQVGETNFGYIATRAYNLYKLGDIKNSAVVEELTAFCYRDPIDGKWTKTGPVIRSAGGGGFLQISGAADQADREDTFMENVDNLDKIDAARFANVRFVNYAARALANRFGYEAIEPLGLPLLMIEHRTFNIGGLSLPVQASSAAPISYSQALIWLIGMHRRVVDLADMMTIKSTIKMLLTKGNTPNHVAGLKKGTEVASTDVIDRLRNKYSSMPLMEF